MKINLKNKVNDQSFGLFEKIIKIISIVVASQPRADVAIQRFRYNLFLITLHVKNNYSVNFFTHGFLAQDSLQSAALMLHIFFALLGLNFLAVHLH
jgi:hypothetical protein